MFKDDTWAAVKRELDEMLARDRARLESPNSTHDETNVTRGRIAALKELLALPEKKAREAQVRNGDPA